MDSDNVIIAIRANWSINQHLLVKTTVCSATVGGIIRFSDLIKYMYMCIAQRFVSLLVAKRPRYSDTLRVIALVLP